jgi:uncharacterized protein YbjT (DUF2867 family)
MRIFITGANGYIGGAVAAPLLDSGHHVAGLVRDEAGAAGLATATPVHHPMDRARARMNPR